MGTMTSQITSLTIVYSTVYSDADQRKHQSSSSLAFVRGILRGRVNSPHKWPVAEEQVASPLAAGSGATWVFHHTWRALQMRFREVANTWLMHL